MKMMAQFYTPVKIAKFVRLLNNENDFFELRFADKTGRLCDDNLTIHYPRFSIKDCNRTEVTGCKLADKQNEFVCIELFYVDDDFDIELHNDQFKN